jgi:hypothetical protein
MMRLFIEGRQLDIAENEALQVTREIADIREPDARSSDWSKTYRIPGTANNNKIFGHIFDINQEQLNTGTQFAPDFNPNKKASALVTVDEVEQVRGYMRLLNINVTRRGEIEYEVSVHGEGADLFAKIRERKLYELNLSEFNHTVTKTIVKNSWSHNWANGYVYPLIDIGRGANLDVIWGVNELTPCVFAKPVVDRIFSDAGFSYTADSFFNSDEFKEWVIPAPGFTRLTQDEIDNRAAKAQRSSGANYAIGATVVFNDKTSTGMFDPGSNFDTSTGKYTAPAWGGRYAVAVNLDVTVTGLSDITYPTLTVEFGIYVDGRLAETVNSGFMTNNAVGGASRTSFSVMQTIFAGFGEEIELRPKAVYDLGVGSSATIIATGFTITVNTGSYIRIYPLAQGGQTIDFNSFFSAQDWTQGEFLRTMIRMANLYIEPTGRANELHIAPRDEFYRDTVIHDLTAKIDRSQPMTITPMGELEGNPYVFTYKQGQDTDSKEYADAMGRVYGEARVFTDNDFIKSEKKIEIPFVSTPYISGNGGKIRIAAMQTERKTQGELRILYWSGKVSNESWLLADEVVSPTYWIGGEKIDGGYPHAGHLDDPFTPTKDLNFGMPYYINLPAGVSYTNNNLVNRYWRKYLAEVADRNSKLVTCMVNLRASDWAKWSFRDLYFFDGQYFRLNKIIDYVPGGEDLTRCEFLKLKTAAVFTPSTGDAGGGYDIRDDYNERWPDLYTGGPGQGRKFAWATHGGGGQGYRPVFDWLQGVDNLTRADIGTPGTGDTYRPAIQWTGADWNIVLIQEP